MPTYAQLQSETWWVREIVTPELADFGKWVRDHYNLAADAIGNKGNNVHLNGSHRSQEWILKSKYCTNRTYTVQAGLTADQARCVAGEDLTPKSTADMLLWSKRIDTATRAGQLEEIVYWYGNVNGDTRVDGYDNIRNVAASSDSSHLWHLHLSFDRRVLRNADVMRRVYAVLTGQEIDDMANTWTEPLTQGAEGFAGQQRDTALAFAWQAANNANDGVQQLLVEVAALKAVATTGVDPAALQTALVAAFTAVLQSPEGKAAIVAAVNTAEDS